MNIIKPAKLIDGESLGSSFYSEILRTDKQKIIGIQLKITGDATGTFNVQMCGMDITTVSENDLVWLDYLVSPDVDVNSGVFDASSSSNYYIELADYSFPLLRLKYTATSGSGTCDAYFSAK